MAGQYSPAEHTIQQMVALNSGPWISPAGLDSILVNRTHERDMDAPQSPGNLQAQVALYSPVQSVTPLAEVEKKGHPARH